MYSVCCSSLQCHCQCVCGMCEYRVTYNNNGKMDIKLANSQLTVMLESAILLLLNCVRLLKVRLITLNLQLGM